MDELDPIDHVESVSITVLVDNKADLIVESSDQIEYYRDGPLLAEHGFSALIQLEDSPTTILWDAGYSEIALMENLQRLGLDPSSIASIAISHGHLDHYASVTRLLHEISPLPEAKEWSENIAEGNVETWVDKHRIPIIAHPAAYRERWRRKKDGTLLGPYPPAPQDEWRSLGAHIVLSEGPCQLAPGCWTTGYVPRESFETAGIPSRMLYREGSDLLADQIEDDQSIIISLRDKGLVILAGCAHAGIVNTINYARQLTGVDRVYAVMGGLHLATSTDRDIDRTVDYLKALDLGLVVPSHCTGFQAASRIAQEMPDAFVESVVGAKYQL